MGIASSLHVSPSDTAKKALVATLLLARPHGAAARPMHGDRIVSFVEPALQDDYLKATMYLQRSPRLAELLDEFEVEAPKHNLTVRAGHTTRSGFGREHLIEWNREQAIAPLTRGRAENECRGSSAAYALMHEILHGLTAMNRPALRAFLRVMPLRDFANLEEHRVMSILNAEAEKLGEPLRSSHRALPVAATSVTEKPYADCHVPRRDAKRTPVDLHLLAARDLRRRTEALHMLITTLQTTGYCDAACVDTALALHRQGRELAVRGFSLTHLPTEDAAREMQRYLRSSRHLGELLERPAPKIRDFDRAYIRYLERHLRDAAEGGFEPSYLRSREFARISNTGT